MDRENLLREIIEGSPADNAHIERCLFLVDNESDDLVRIYARLWLEYNSAAMGRRLLNQQ